MRRNWNSFIQINIFEKTLEQLERTGVNLEKILTELGCEKHWLGDMPLYSEESDSAMENSFDDTTFLLSSSLSEQHIPRCSTPESSKNMPNFSQCASKVLSRIDSDPTTIELFVSPEDIEPANLSALSVLDKLVQNVCTNEYQKTLTETNLHNNSLESGNNETDVFNGNNVESIRNKIIAETGEEEDNTVYNSLEINSFEFTKSSSSTIQLPTLSGAHPANRHSEYVSPIERKPTIQNNQSLMNLKITSVSVEREERKPLKRTTSEIRRNRRKAMKLIRNNTINPEFVDHPKIVMKPTKIPREISEVLNYNQDLLPVSDDSVRIYTDLTPMSSDGEQYCEIERRFFDMFENESSSHHQTSQNEEFHQSEKANLVPDIKRNSSVFFENQPSTSPNTANINNSYESDDYEQECWDDEQHEGEENFDEQNMDMENDEFHNQDVEKHQAVKKRKRRPKYSEEDYAARNALHRIKCEFERCGAEYNWRPKYGKLRLIDHSRKHCQTDSFHCNLCDFKTLALRSIQKHGSLKHPDQENTEFTVKQVLKTKIDQMELKEIWEKCFRENLDLLGKPNKTLRTSCKNKIL